VPPCHVRSDDVAPVANVLLRCLCMASASRSDSLSPSHYSVKPGTHWRVATKLNSTRSTLLKVNCWFVAGFFRQQTVAETGDKSATIKVDCRQYGQLSCRCVRGQSDTVNFVDFQSFNKITKSTVLNSTLSPVCTAVPGLRFIITGN